MSDEKPTTPASASPVPAAPPAAAPEVSPESDRGLNPEPGGERTMDLVCPFLGQDDLCIYPMSPRKPQPTPKEYKLLKVMGLPVSQDTKIGCVRCSIFIKTWNENMGLTGQVRFLVQRLMEGGRDLFRTRPRHAA